MTTTHAAFGIGFLLGLFAWPIVYRTMMHVAQWRMERDSRAAELRFRGCTHQRTILVDVGSGHRDTPKCLDCWGLKVLQLRPNEGPSWTPNVAPPPKDES